MHVVSFTTKFLFVFTLFLHFTACETEDDNDQKTNDNELITGFWVLKKGEARANNEKGEVIITATLKPDVFAHQFNADGTYEGFDLTGNTPGEKGTYRLEVNKKDNIGADGYLYITTPSSLASKGELFVEKDGSINYSFTTVKSDGKTLLFMVTKKYEAYPYAKNWVNYEYEKK